MKFLKLFALVSIFVASFLIITPNTASAEGSCKVASWVYGTGDDQNGPCVARDFDECEADPYFHLSKVMTCEWDPGTPPSNPPYPEVSILATPHEIVSGGTSKIQWEAVNVVPNSCTLNGSTVSTTGSQNVTLTSTTSYVLVCVASNGGYHVTDNTLVTVTPQPLNVYFDKNPNNFKNLVDYDNGDPIGTVSFLVTITGLNGTGRTCEYYENNQPINPQKKWTADTSTFGETFSRSSLTANTVNSMILCRNAEGGTIYSAHLGTNTQSATVGGATTCNIGFNQDSCQLGINWTTANPYPGNSFFPAVVTDLTVSGQSVDTGNQGSDVTMYGSGMGEGQTQVTKTIDFKNKVDGENGTINTLVEPVDNIMKQQQVIVKCEQGANNAWTSKWSIGLGRCYNALPVVDAGSSVTLTKGNPG
jgi:hypothetical protein